MPTPAERKALLFLAGVILLGASVRVVRAARDDGTDDASTRAALEKQLEAVDSAQREGAGGGAGRRGRVGTARRPPRRHARTATTVTGTESASTRAPTPSHIVSAPAAPPPVIDLDAASQADIESLPRIGPVLARRIVDDRSANGPFGSLEGFERVRGVGPALAAALAGRVTFSGTVRPSNAIADHRLRSPPSSKSARRERRP